MIRKHLRLSIEMNKSSFDYKKRPTNLNISKLSLRNLVLIII